jgi:hypothetical protein
MNRIPREKSVRPLRVRVKIDVPTAMDGNATFEATVDSVSLADVIMRVRGMMEEISKPVIEVEGMPAVDMPGPADVPTVVNVEG